MKCSRCGRNYPDIAAMARHYRKSHPRVMGAKKKKAATGTKRRSRCPTCGKLR